MIAQLNTESDESYKERMLAYSERNDVQLVHLIKLTYTTGELKAIGFKMKHTKGFNDDYLYKVGTWKCYYKNGQLKKNINYNLVQKKEGEYKEYSETGELIKEFKY